ncbi:ABC di/oligopeptide transporter ATPase [Aliidongia dinghuensis]|uniref:ABC di/oligopeptide transporter ATPase n=1 Tax=Aliidongia dinghuensis TaxID=1867774 RepID=A0A8J2YXW3_9PROT|nr:ABC transporter ATP-binding protein [Aliidongia dinghuensis]GGF37557.1 ABC di/oligopeptide transporter ATPase [Aliidongia dinghuensis]
MTAAVKPLLEIDGLTTEVGHLRILDRVSFSIGAGEVVGVVGESGSGKSMTALSTMRLLPETVRVTAGTVRFAGADLLALSEAEMRRIRGDRIAMIFQEPMSSLNPVLSIGEQIVETLVHHRGAGRAEAKRRAIELLELVEIPAAAKRLGDYPHQLSGGMRQRVMIAIALACEPKLLIADEPTTALDVTVQAQILDLLRSLRRELAMSIMLITHDLGVVAEFADRVVVLYAGRVAETGPVKALFRAPFHPYTQGLLGSIPPLDGPLCRPLPIPGTVPALADMPEGCRFQPRCAVAASRCTGAPPFFMLDAGHEAACWRAAPEARVVGEPAGETA